MKKTLGNLEKKKINEVAHSYEENGYSVVKFPDSKVLPAFLKNIQPDLYAYNDVENVIIEVKTKDSPSELSNIDILAKILEGKLNWRFELIVTNPKLPKPPEYNENILSLNEINDRILEINNLINDNKNDAAFLLGWSTLEAVFRNKSKKEKIEMNLPISNLIKTYLSRGMIDKEDYLLLNNSLKKRNSLFHGYQSEISSNDIINLLNVISSLLHPKKYPTITMVISGDQTYYVGEKIRLFGTYTGKLYEIYIYLTKPDNPDFLRSLENVTDSLSNYTKIPIRGDNTWEYLWDTSYISRDLDQGVYRIVAVTPENFNTDRKKSESTTVDLILKNPFISAMIQNPIISDKGEISIFGTATGDPQSVNIWIFGGFQKIFVKEVKVKNDSSFEFSLKNEKRDFFSNIGYIVIQHPMTNKKFDVKLQKDEVSGIWSGSERVSTVNLAPIECAEKVISFLNNPKCDDTYTKLSFMIEN